MVFVNKKNGPNTIARATLDEILISNDSVIILQVKNAGHQTILMTS